MALPTPLRNRLADAIVAAFHDRGARDRLRELAERQRPPHGAEVAERAARALGAIACRGLDPAEPPLAVALEQAALLFDARLYFEVHERLEPLWLRASGADREALQGAIQVAVGLHHLGNGNLAGARALLRDGAAKLVERQVAGVDFDAFARAIAATLPAVIALGDDPSRFDWRALPRFPGDERRDGAG